MVDVPEALEDGRLKDEGTITPRFICSASPEKMYLHCKIPDRYFFYIVWYWKHSDTIIPYAIANLRKDEGTDIRRGALKTSLRVLCWIFKEWRESGNS